MNTTDVRHSVRALLDAQTASGRHTIRRVKDQLARYAIAIGGSAVILAVLLILFYLVSVVLPVFGGAEVKAVGQPMPAAPAHSLMTRVDEYGELALQFGNDGVVRFTRTDTGATATEARVPLPEGAQVVSAAELNASEGLYALGLSDGRALVALISYKLSYDADAKRIVEPLFSLPYGEEPLVLDSDGRALQRLTGAGDGDGFTLAAQVGEREIAVTRHAIEENLLEDSKTVEAEYSVRLNTQVPVRFNLLDPSGRWLYAAAADGAVEAWELTGEQPVRRETAHVVEAGRQLTELRFLFGGISLLAGDSKGRIGQWFRVRDEHNAFHLKQVRSFELGDAPIVKIAAERRRKGFLAFDDASRMGVFYTTSHRSILIQDLPQPAVDAQLNARGTVLLLTKADGSSQRYSVDNPHPEVSWSALWEEVWYESYPEASYTWQSTSGVDEFEPKLSLMPLAFGTIKAALYAMLFALPIGICGAMYTAYFMAPAMRQTVKPVIEIMAALPSVILGFLAGLWLAPALEAHMPGFFALMILLPLGMIGFGYFWHHAPRALRQRVPDGWQAILLIPVIALLSWLSFTLSLPMEELFFDGNMRGFVTNTLGLGYEQRNALVVGIAMGFAVIPSIFSIAEDAIFGVPKSLTNGSLALGASPWQTMVRVVLPTASPGIFSAVMIGLGRAVGETMIVLMATGNTPVMEANIFEGLRTLSANIAVEMPESEVGGTHYRVLFLSALVLFLITMVFNTVAEVVRQRLRRKYGSL